MFRSALPSLVIVGSGTVSGTSYGITQSETDGTLVVTGTGEGLVVEGGLFGVHKGGNGGLVLNGKISATATGQGGIGIRSMKALTISAGSNITAVSRATSYNDEEGAQCGIYSMYGPITIEGSTATATLKADANNTYVWADGATAAKKVSWKIAPASVSSAALTKAKSLKKKALSFAPVKLATDGKVAYSVAKKDSKEAPSLNKKTGKVAVKKGTKKGKYVIKVRVSAKAGNNYSAFKAKTYKVQVTVK